MSDQRFSPGHELGGMICNALGIETKGVTGLDISLTAHGPATIRISKHITVEGSEALAEVFEQFELSRKVQ